MFRILRKIKRQEPLLQEEEQQLREQLTTLMSFPNANWRQFFEYYAHELTVYYHIQLPLFSCDMDILYNWLLQNPTILHHIEKQPFTQKEYPSTMADYLIYTFGSEITSADIQPLLKYFQETLEAEALPPPRSKPPTFKYEENNPYKEIGLKNHFERLARYAFISRIQSYRYLAGGRASADRFEVLADDTLSGIFTNKEKSIYYYVYLTERNAAWAQNACRLLNQVFYGK